MIETITAVNQAVNQFIWGVPAMVCIIGVGLLLSVRTGFLQIRKFPYAIKITIGRMFRKKDASDGAMTPFQAVCTALAGTVGTGNVAGAHGAGQCGAHRLEGGYGTVRSVLFAEHASDGGFDGVREFADLQKAGAHAQQQTHTNDAHHGGYAPDKIVDCRIDGRDRLDHNSSHILCKVLRSDTFCQRNIKTILPYFCAAVK